MVEMELCFMTHAKLKMSMKPRSLMNDKISYDNITIEF